MSTLKSFQHQYTKSNEKALASFTLPKAQFPNRNDVIQRTFLTRKLKPLPPPEENEESQWLYPDKIPDSNVSLRVFLFYPVLTLLLFSSELKDTHQKKT
jgi:hypothetical protein